MFTVQPGLSPRLRYVRNTTARAFAVVASALGIPSLLPFLKAVCRSKKSWQARHTGIKIIQQVAILMGCAILPHLRSLVEIIEHGALEGYPGRWGWRESSVGGYNGAGGGIIPPGIND